jgi:hypothetical protein
MCARNVNIYQREGNSITLNLLDLYDKCVLAYPFQVNDIHSVIFGTWFKRGRGSIMLNLFVHNDWKGLMSKVIYRQKWVISARNNQ